jgi:hypothetical protein
MTKKNLEELKNSIKLFTDKYSEKQIKENKELSNLMDSYLKVFKNKKE